MSVEPSPQSVEPAVFKKFLIVTCHNVGGVQTRSIFEKEARLLLPYFTPTYEFHAVSLPPPERERRPALAFRSKWRNGRLTARRLANARPAMVVKRILYIGLIISHCGIKRWSSMLA